MNTIGTVRPSGAVGAIRGPLRVVGAVEWPMAPGILSLNGTQEQILADNLTQFNTFK